MLEYEVDELALIKLMEDAVIKCKYEVKKIKSKSISLDRCWNNLCESRWATIKEFWHRIRLWIFSRWTLVKID